MIEKEPGSIVGPFAMILGFVINLIYNAINFIASSPANILGVSIIILTVFVRFFMIPTGIKSQKSAIAMRKLAPEIKAIKERYGGTKDPELLRKQNAEIQALYSKNNVNMFGSCLPLLLTLPVFYGLNVVFRNSYMYIDQMNVMYEEISMAVMRIPNYQNIIRPIALGHIPDKMLAEFKTYYISDLQRLVGKLAPYEWDLFTLRSFIDIGIGDFRGEIEALLSQKDGLDAITQNGLGELLRSVDGFLDSKAVFDGLLNQFIYNIENNKNNKETVGRLIAQIGLMKPQMELIIQQAGGLKEHLPELGARLAAFTSDRDKLAVLLQQKAKCENFLTLNLSEPSGWGFPGVIIPVLTAATTFLSTFLTGRANKTADAQAKSQQRMMLIMMPLLFGWITVGMSAAVGIYWITSSVFATVQQVFINRYYRKKDNISQNDSKIVKVVQ